MDRDDDATTADPTIELDAIPRALDAWDMTATLVERRAERLLQENQPDGLVEVLRIWRVLPMRKGLLALYCLERGHVETGILLAASQHPYTLDIIHWQGGRVLRDALIALEAPWRDAAAYVIDGRRECEPLLKMLDLARVAAAAAEAPPTGDPVQPTTTDPDAATPPQARPEASPRKSREQEAIVYLERTARRTQSVPSRAECARMVGASDRAWQSWPEFSRRHGEYERAYFKSRPQASKEQSEAILTDKHKWGRADR